MAASGTYSVAIVAKDSASGVLDSINKRMAGINKEVARARAPFEQLTKNFDKLVGTTGLDKVGAGLQSVARHSLDAFRSVTRIVEPLAAISGAASVAGMYKLATAWAEFGTALGNASVRAGLTATQLHTLENAGRLAGVSADAVASGMTTLRDNMIRAQGGQAPQVIGMLQALGLSADGARRYAANTTKALPELADKIAALKDPTLQAQAATTLFGGAGEALLPFLRKGSAGIAEYEDRVRRYGVVNQGGVDAANKLREAQTNLILAVEGFGNAISEKVAPYLGPLLTNMADWIARNKEWLASDIGDAVGKFAKWLQDTDWAKIGTDIKGIYTAANTVAEALGGWVHVGEGLLAFFAVSWVAKMLLPIATITKALIGLPGAAASAAVKANVELEKVKPGGNWFGRAAQVASSALMADQVVTAADPNDATGAWIDKHVPGASWLDNAASYIGMGRSYAEQLRVEGALHPAAGWFGQQVRGGPRTPSSPAGAPGQSTATSAASHADFYQKWGPAAERAAAQLGVDKNTILGHWAQETAYGRNIHDNNPGNIQAGSGYTGPTVVRGDTHADGSAYRTQFRSYATPEQFADDYAALIKRRYQGAVGVGSDALRYGQALKAGGYMENPNGPADIANTAARVSREEASFTPQGPDRNLPANAGTASNPGGAPAATVTGQIGVGITVNGPADTKVVTTQTGPNLAPLKVERSQVGFTGQAFGGT